MCAALQQGINQIFDTLPPALVSHSASLVMASPENTLGDVNRKYWKYVLSSSLAGTRTGF